MNGVVSSDIPIAFKCKSFVSLSQSTFFLSFFSPSLSLSLFLKPSQKVFECKTQRRLLLSDCFRRDGASMYVDHVWSRVSQSPSSVPKPIVFCLVRRNAERLSAHPLHGTDMNEFEVYGIWEGVSSFKKQSYFLTYPTLVMLRRYTQFLDSPFHRHASRTKARS